MFPQLFRSSRTCLSWMRERYGLLRAIEYFLKGRIFHGGLVRLPVADTHIWIRPETTDFCVVDEIFFQDSYGAVQDPPELVVDAGGHIGAATLYLATRFPRARIFVIEPDDQNFKLLVRNTSRLPNVERLKAGLWSDNSSLKINNPGDSPWAFNLSAGDGGVKGVTIPDILRLAGRQNIDVLKIDIEGAEVEVLNSSAHWIDRVGLLMVELHDRFRPGCTEALQRAVAGRGFQESTSGEYVVMRQVA